MRSVLLSIKPQYCELIASGKKTVDVRKTRPTTETPFKVFIYCTQPKYEHEDFITVGAGTDKAFAFYGGGKVIGEFVCDKIFEIDFGIEEGVYFDGKFQKGFETNGKGDNPTCLSFIDLENYLTDNEGYGWHISDLKIYDEPKELGEFCKTNILSYDDWLYGIYNGRGGATASYESYKNFFRIKRPPQSWCYVEEV